MACSTFARVAGETRSGRLSTLLTVPSETPASAATSLTEEACTTATARTCRRRVVAQGVETIVDGGAYAIDGPGAASRHRPTNDPWRLLTGVTTLTYRPR